MPEIEIKLPIGPAEDAIRSIQDLGAHLVHERTCEDNVLFDYPSRTLRSRGALLRVRKLGNSGCITYKEPAPGPAGYKVRREIESPVGSPDLIVRILESAGLERMWRYVKFRTAFSDGDLKVFVDEVPIGNFIELEGAPDAIDGFARRLGRSPSEYVRSTYWSLFMEWSEKSGVPAGDMLFG